MIEQEIPSIQLSYLDFISINFTYIYESISMS